VTSIALAVAGISGARLAMGFAIALAIAIAALRMRALTRSGAIAAVVVGTTAYGFGGPTVAAAVIAFFVSGSLLSRLPGAAANRARRMATKGATRDAMQVLANGGAAAACAIVAGAVSPERAMAWIAAAVGAIAASAADTWATEVGALSPSAPRSIATWRGVRPGVSGGVTPLGTLASAAGGAFIGAVASGSEGFAGLARWTIFGAIAGIAGSALDSLLGAAVQGAYHCDACGEPCEARAHRCGESARHVGGFAWLDNDGVNAIASAGGALLGLALSGIVF